MKVTANAFDRLWDACRSDVLAATEAVGASGWWILGQQVSGFETDLAHFCNVSNAVGCANGMDAIEIALRAIGIGPGDKVLTTPLSAFATALAITRAGAEPVYADVTEDGLLDPAAVEEAFAVHPGMRAVLPVHLYGHLADCVKLAEIAQRGGAAPVEDAAQAIGASRCGVQVGQYGNATCFSFYPTKNLGAIGDAGAIVTPDAAIAARAKIIRNYGQGEKYVHSELGLNSRLDELHAAILRTAFLPRLAEWTERRRSIAATYLDNIRNIHVRCIAGPDIRGSVWHLFPVLVAPNRRLEFVAYLAAQGLQANLHYPIVIPDQAAMHKHGKPLAVGNLKNARHLAESEVSLPINAFLQEDEIGHVVDTVNGWQG